MALVTRLTRLFQADFHAVLDRIEEPELQLRQAVREMQFALEQDRQRLQLLRHEAAELGKAVEAAEARLQSLDEELDICLAANEEDLARDLVRRKLAAERQASTSRERGANIERQCGELARRIEEQTQQLDSMQQKLELLAGGDEQIGSHAAVSGDAIRNEEIEIALLREKQRRAKS
jgi:phage shock protein A